MSWLRNDDRKAGFEGVEGRELPASGGPSSGLAEGFMKAFTLECPGRCEPGIAVQGGAIVMGVRLMDHKPQLIQLDPRAVVRSGRLVEAPGRGALLLLRDQSGVFGSWHLRAAHPAERWDAMVATESIPNALDRILAAERVRARFPHRAPVGWYEFARGTVSPITENARPRIDLYGYLEEGASFEIRRRGKLDGTPSVFVVECRNGDVNVYDPRLAALSRRQQHLAASL